MKAQNQDSLFKVAEIKISYAPKIKSGDRPLVVSSREAFEIFSSRWDQNRIELNEQCMMLILNRANRVLGIFEVSSGGHSGTVLDPKLFLSLR